MLSAETDHRGHGDGEGGTELELVGEPGGLVSRCGRPVLPDFFALQVDDVAERRAGVLRVFAELQGDFRQFDQFSMGKGQAGVANLHGRLLLAAHDAVHRLPAAGWIALVQLQVVGLIGGHGAPIAGVTHAEIPTVVLPWVPLQERQFALHDTASELVDAGLQLAGIGLGGAVVRRVGTLCEELPAAGGLCGDQVEEGVDAGRAVEVGQGQAVVVIKVADHGGDDARRGTVGVGRQRGVGQHEGLVVALVDIEEPLRGWCNRRLVGELEADVDGAHDKISGNRLRGLVLGLPLIWYSHCALPALELNSAVAWV